MSAPFTPHIPGSNYNASTQQTPRTPTPVGRGRPRATVVTTGAKRGRKPRGATTGVGTTPPRIIQDALNNSPTPTFTTTNYTHVHWALPTSSSSTNANQTNQAVTSITGGTTTQSRTPALPLTPATPTSQGQSQQQPIIQVQPQSATANIATTSVGSTATHVSYAFPGSSSTPRLDTTGLLTMPSTAPGVTLQTTVTQAQTTGTRLPGMDDDGEGDDELLPAMADDDYSAQLSWQSQSKENLKVLMDNFAPAQYDRFEAYRRHALPKQAVKKVIQQTVGQQVSQPVAQIVAGFAKVFVGEMIEKARAVQTRRGETGPLSPDHLREAYRMYQSETGRVGAARPLRSKKLFVR
ncbi:hypothetical protein AX15_001500 [Amanita polypyramis BW_CC]|nr:hypothetical protein AX15_001500 [Amanita polypyramis BW_CC]